MIVPLEDDYDNESRIFSGGRQKVRKKAAMTLLMGLSCRL